MPAAGIRGKCAVLKFNAVGSCAEVKDVTRAANDRSAAAARTPHVKIGGDRNRCCHIKGVSSEVQNPVSGYRGSRSKLHEYGIVCHAIACRAPGHGTEDLCIPGIKLRQGQVISSDVPDRKST